jgi:hypothetical protein
MSDVMSRILSGHRPSLVEKAETCVSVEELDGFLAGFALTGREPSREVVEAVARRRAELKVGGRA